MIIQNALKSIVRSKGRNILIAIIIVAIALSSSVALAIRGAAQSAVNDGFDSTNITGTIGFDRSSMMSGGRMQFTPGDMSSIQDMMRRNQGLPIDDLLYYADSSYVKDFYYSASLGFDEVDGDIVAFSNGDSGYGGGFMTVGRGGMSFSQGSFTVVGCSSASALTHGYIVEGALFDFDSPALECVVSKNLADLNGISIGDSIRLSNPNNADEIYAFLVVGIYTSSETSDSSDAFTVRDPDNQIYVGFAAAAAIVAMSEESKISLTDERSGSTYDSAYTLTTSGTYVFDSKEDYDAFSGEIHDRGLDATYVLSSPDLDSYEASLTPLKNLSKFALVLLLIILAVGAVVLIILNIFNIRERKYEVGVLCAIGIKKSKVAAQFISELLIVTLVAVILGAGVGALVSPPVSDAMLASQVSSAKNDAADNGPVMIGPNGNGGQQLAGRPTSGRQGTFGGTPLSNVNYIDTINATVGGMVLLQLIGIAVLLTIVSSLVGVVFVLRYDPLKILSERT